MGQRILDMDNHRFVSEIVWSGKGDFESNKYSRAHEWRFDGGTIVPASSSPTVVPVPYSVEAAVDPEEAFLAALASCHMLWFLDLARRSGLIVDKYSDKSVAEMERVEKGRLAITNVTLNPVISVVSEKPADHELEQLHEEAHKRCFIANSVKCNIQINPTVI